MYGLMHKLALGVSIEIDFKHNARALGTALWYTPRNEQQKRVYLQTDI